MFDQGPNLTKNKQNIRSNMEEIDTWWPLRFSRRQEEAGRADFYHEVGMLGFNEDAAWILMDNDISEFFFLLSTRSGTYGALTNAHRGTFTVEDMKQIEAFRERVGAYRNAYDGSTPTDWV